MNSTSTSDPVAKVLLPVLVHEVNNTTQLLVGLRALLDIPGGDALFAERTEDLARASQRMDELGFALAVLASANGSNMLLARRDERAISILWRLAVQSLERSGEAKVAVFGDPPLMASSALDGWQLPWSAAAVLLVASEATGVDSWRWRWEDDGRLVGRCASDIRELEALLTAIAERVPGVSITHETATLTWSVPDSMLGT